MHQHCFDRNYSRIVACTELLSVRGVQAVSGVNASAMLPISIDRIGLIGEVDLKRHRQLVPGTKDR
jgi:hypothetical protein